MFENADYTHSYSRAQAIADGVLVDVRTPSASVPTVPALDGMDGLDGLDGFAGEGPGP
jgi:hypothetical protein